MKTLLERKDNVLTLVAFASLKHNGESTEYENIEAEKYRLERVAEKFYLKTDKKNKKSDQEYNVFIIDWIKKNINDLVYSDKYVFDVTIPDNAHDLNINNFMR